MTGPVRVALLGCGTIARDVHLPAFAAAGRDLVDRLRPLLNASGVKSGYPTLIWWAKDGSLNGCACQAPQSDKYIRKDLGAE